MTVEILDSVNDCAAWHARLAQLPSELRDVYFRPDYASLHLGDAGTRALLFVYEREGEVWLCPFLLRRIEKIGASPLSSLWFDIETPYGYGGPVSGCGERRFLAEAHAEFDGWCRDQRVVTEFVRLHPLIENERWLDPRAEIVFDRTTVSLCLRGLGDGGRDEPPFDVKTRHMLRRAERLGVRIESRPASGDFDKFVKLYRLTMNRVGADKYYYFDEKYFEGLRRLSRECGWLLAAERGGKWIAAALFLRGDRWLHYHLSASGEEGRLPGATNLLIYAAALRGSREGLSRLHLGGGTGSAPDDPLFTFKQKMSTHTHSFKIGKRVHRPDIYAELRDAWERDYPALVGKYGRRVQCYRYSE